MQCKLGRCLSKKKQWTSMDTFLHILNTSLWSIAKWQIICGDFAHASNVFQTMTWCTIGLNFTSVCCCWIQFWTVTEKMIRIQARQSEKERVTQLLAFQHVLPWQGKQATHHSQIVWWEHFRIYNRIVAHFSVRGSPTAFLVSARGAILTLNFGSVTNILLVNQMWTHQNKN